MNALLLAVILAAGPFPDAVERGSPRCVYSAAEGWAPITVAAATEFTFAGNAGWGRFLDADADVVRASASIPWAYDGTKDLFWILHLMPDTTNAVDEGETIVMDVQWHKNTGTVHTVASATATHTQVGSLAANSFFDIVITIDHDDVNNVLEPCRIVDGVEECDRIWIGTNHDRTNSTYNGGTSRVFIFGATLCAQ